MPKKVIENNNLRIRVLYRPPNMKALKPHGFRAFRYFAGKSFLQFTRKCLKSYEKTPCAIEAQGVFLCLNCRENVTGRTLETAFPGAAGEPRHDRPRPAMG